MASYECLYPECSMNLVSLRRLCQHMTFVHGSGISCLLKCKVGNCERTYTTSESYRKHVERAHWCVLEREKSAGTRCNSIGNGESEVLNIADRSTEGEQCPVSDQDGDLNTFSHSLTRSLSLFVLKTREKYMLPKSAFTSLMNDVIDLAGMERSHISDLLRKELHAENTEGRSCVITNVIENTESLLKQSWMQINTDCKLNAFCRAELNLVEPREIVLGENADTKRNDTYQYVPILETLRVYLQHEDVQISIEHQRVKQPKVLYEYTDGDAFMSHPIFSKIPDALRLHFYTDDVEICNPLGGAKKKHALMGVYFTVGNIEQKYLSSLCNIHVAILCKSSLVKKYGLQKVLSPLIADICHLETTGIDIALKTQTKHVFGSLATVSADNLASHEIGGFRKCFSSGRVCRFCMINYTDLSKYYSETQDNFPALRVTKTHKKHVDAVCSDPSLASAYGVSGEAAFHHLDSFDATHSLPPDCMHDILEGVIPITLRMCLRGLIKSKFFTVKTLNERLRRFHFGSTDSANVPPAISETFQNNNISGSASQKFNLFRNLAFIIGDLVDHNSKFWQLYILCRRVVEAILSPAVRVHMIAYLDTLISDFLRMVCDLAPTEFVPKFHYLTHYPRLMAKYGPLRYHWCFRYESYHSRLKSIAKRTGNFINICYTLAERNQMKKCWEQSLTNCLQPEEVVTGEDEISLSALPASAQHAVSEIFGCTSADKLLSVRSAQLKGIHYAVSNYFILDVTNDDIPIFFHVLHILKFNGLWGLAGHLATCSYFNEHYFAYEICAEADWMVISPGQEKDFHALDGYIVDVAGEHIKMIALRHMF